MWGFCRDGYKEALVSRTSTSEPLIEQNHAETLFGDTTFRKTSMEASMVLFPRVVVFMVGHITLRNVNLQNSPCFDQAQCRLHTPLALSTINSLP